MKNAANHLVIALVALLSIGSIPLKAEDQFDAALKDLRASAAISPPAELKGDQTKMAEWFKEHESRITAEAQRLYELDPADPRRWEAAAIYVKAAGLQGMNPDTPRVRKALEIISLAAVATDVPETTAVELQAGLVMHHMAKVWLAQMQGGKPDLVPLRQSIDVFSKRFPDKDDNLVSFEWAYVFVLSKQDESAATAWINKLTMHPNAKVAAQAKAQLRVESFRYNPPTIKFTAMDGREVDFEQLRGKVVLVDFWATWCGPCVAEIPNVKAAYDKYHAHGFEVLGITLDAAKDRQKVLKFIEDRQLAWPQHLDEVNKRNYIAVDWGIVGIPATFLFGQDGKLVMKDVKGEALEREVKRLLKL